MSEWIGSTYCVYIIGKQDFRLSWRIYLIFIQFTVYIVFNSITICLSFFVVLAKRVLHIRFIIVHNMINICFMPIGMKMSNEDFKVYMLQIEVMQFKLQ